MKKLLAVISAAFVVAALGAVDAGAKDMTKMRSVGWYDGDAPIGGGIWFNPKVGVQAGVGFHSSDIEGEDTELALAGAVPIVLAGSQRVNFMFRPGILFQSNPGTGIDSRFSVRGDLAIEVFLTDRFSVIGGHGVEFINESYDNGSAAKVGDLRPLGTGDTGDDSASVFKTREISSSNVGFMFYFPG